MCYDPLSKRSYVSPHARFVETEFPAGLVHATRPTTTPHGNVVHPPSPPTAPDVTKPENTTGSADVEQLGDARIQAKHENDNSVDGEGTLAQRLSRRQRTPAAVVASDLLAEPACHLSSTYAAKSTGPAT
eukprot:5182650-Pleurochrysis_carterae.AAC.2